MARALGRAACLLACLALGPAGPARADPATGPAHGLAMHGEPALGPAFEALPYADPEAPRGGTLAFALSGGFDSLNPFVLKGRAPWPLAGLTHSTLLERSWDEPFTLYASLAESVETPPDRSWVAFTLDPRARFSDGSPVTVEDVIWSIETLGREGHPRYRAAWNAVSAIEKTGPRALRIEFASANRELPLLMGLRPILKKGQIGDRALDADPMEPLIGSGPYRVAEAEPPHRLVLERVEDWWGDALPVNRGRHNAERLVYDFYRDGDALWSAVKTGAVSIFEDGDPVRWAEGYDFPLAREGGLLQAEIPHGRPSGMEGFVFNTRRPPFDDRRMRRALALAFDWEWVNARLYRGAYARITSYYGGSHLAAEGPAGPREAALLAPFADALPEGTLEAPWRPPETDGSGRDRRALREAARLLDAAGWPVRGGRRANAEGEPLGFEILVRSGEHQTLAELWSASLDRLGVAARVRLVDDAAFETRRRDYDYDVTVNRWWLSLSPGTEQWLYWGSEGRETPGTRNYMGVADPAVDAMIEAMVGATSEDDFVAAVRALDRVLTAGVYVVPFGTLEADRVAHLEGLGRPERAALYGHRPEVWWVAPD